MADSQFYRPGLPQLISMIRSDLLTRFEQDTLLRRMDAEVYARVTPTDYGNFDERYQTKTGGVQDVRLGSAIGIGRGGNAPSGHLLSGVDGGEKVDWANARPVQVLINGVWRNVASL